MFRKRRKRPSESISEPIKCPHCTHDLGKHNITLNHSCSVYWYEDVYIKNLWRKQYHECNCPLSRAEVLLNIQKAAIQVSQEGR